jgi:molybdate transport system substrate-binding protein
VLVVPADQPRQVTIGPIGPIGLEQSWFAAVPNGRIATGDPAHVPVGKYAKQAMTSLGLWDVVAPRLARADSVRSALLLVERGEAVAGIVYKTDAAASKKVVVAGTFPATTHDPISYPVALLRSSDQGEATRFVAFLSSAEARAIFTKHGFVIR